MNQENLGLLDLVNLGDWQKIQDLLADVLGIALKTVSTEDRLISKESNPSRFCTEILPKVANHPEFSDCTFLKNNKNLCLNIKEKMLFECSFGLHGFVLPIKAVGDKIIAYIIAGPVILKTRQDEDEYAKDAKRYGIALEDLNDALIDINVFSYNKIYSMMKLIEHVFTHITQTNYHKKRLGEIVPEIIEVEPIFSRYYEEKILRELLEACLLVLNADTGSVMTLDENRDTLHVKVHFKLEENIVDNSDVKVGEGIAGYAFKHEEPIILPKDEAKSGLSEKLKRKDIKSSMVIPFHKGNGDGVYGVINLNVIRKEKDFSDKDIAVVKKLIKLACIALIPLQNSSLTDTPK